MTRDTNNSVSPVKINSGRRDGTSQDSRRLPALDPASAPIDERSVADLLRFAKAYARELHFFNPQNLPDGDWTALFEADPAALERLLTDGAPAAANAIPGLQPPMALLLTFLDLLQYARGQMNDLTRRHLEFYYREVLRLTPTPPVADRVHVLVELAPDRNAFALPAGTLLNAGKDSRDQDLVYRTEADLVVNRARVADLKSLFVERRLIGLAEAYDEPDSVVRLFPKQSAAWADLPFAERSFMAMLALALGEPGPGGVLPPYPTDGQVLDSVLLRDLDALIVHIRRELAMPLPAFRSLMELRRRREAADAEWEQINAALLASGKERERTFSWDEPFEPRNFERNLLRALGLADFNTFFNTLPAVANIYDLYRQRERADVREFIDQGNLFMDFDRFTAMMSLVDAIYGDWRRIYDILRTAGRRKRPGERFVPPQLRAYDPAKFESLIASTIGALADPQTTRLNLSGPDAWYAAILDLERYFHMPVEEFGAIRAIVADRDRVQSWERRLVYAALEQAHIQRDLERRWAALDAARRSGDAEAMLQLALGDPEPGDPLPNQRDFLGLDANSDERYISEQLYLAPSNFQLIKDTISRADPNDAAWANVYKILELADRRKRGRTTSRPEVEQWENAYAAADATLVQAGRDQADDATPRWHTFGATPGGPAQTASAPAVSGIAVTSPLLALAEGERTITVQFVFYPEHFDIEAIAATREDVPFRLLLSSGGELIAAVPQSAAADEEIPIRLEPFTIDTAEDQTGTLTFIVRLSAEAPPIEPLAAEAGIASPWPVLQLVTADRRTANNRIFRAFQGLRLRQVRLNVDVKGISNLQLQSDESLINPKKPFEPFGFAPLPGSGLYIAHPELCSKGLDRLDFQITWMGAPSDFRQYYRGYAGYDNPVANPAGPIGANGDFKARLRLYDRRTYFDVTTIQLFDTQDATRPYTIPITGSTITAANSNYQSLLHLQPADDVQDWRRFWQIELQAPDFQHQVYPQAATGYARRRTNGEADPFIVNQPYTPRIKHLSAGYSAGETIEPGAGNPYAGAALQHIEPFGRRALAPDDDGFFPFLPQYPHEGELYIGLADLQPPQNLALLFQLAEGSADPSLAHEPVRWSYLDDDRWQSLEQGRILADGTNGLLNSGIINFELPPVAPSTRLPAGRYWLRAAVARNSRSIADTVAILSQAVQAVFIDKDNAPDHLAQPLPPDTIRSTVEPLPAIQAIRQPYSSSGGKGAEDPARFYVRASERLRHKARALTGWDYERLVLEAFPEIYKVKCLPAGTATDPLMRDRIQVIVIPNIKGKLPFDPFEPKVAADSLHRIESYLAERTPASAHFTIVNPTYVRLQIRIGVRLKAGHTPGFYLQLLNQELQRFLAPWAYDRSAEIVFGGKINANVIVNFVEERPYIDYVAGIRLFVRNESSDNRPLLVENHYVVPPNAILVSERRHQIDLIGEEQYQEQFFSGINHMQIELDFQVA